MWPMPNLTANVRSRRAINMQITQAETGPTTIASETQKGLGKAIKTASLGHSRTQKAQHQPQI